MKKLFYVICLIIATICADCGNVKKMADVLFKGIILATEHEVGIPSQIDIYYKERLVKKLETDSDGMFSFFFNQKHIGKEYDFVITPVRHGIVKDTTYRHFDQVTIICKKWPAKEFLSDTLIISMKKTNNRKLHIETCLARAEGTYITKPLRYR